MLVRDIMTSSPVIAVPGDTIAAAAHLMSTQGVGLLPVVESRIYRELVGVVTDRDLVARVLAARRELSDRVSEIMSPVPIATVGPLDDVGAALETMNRERVRRLPVVDEDGIVLGIVSRVDIARIAADVAAQVEAAT
jgi:CBS domain-containing protein